MRNASSRVSGGQAQKRTGIGADREPVLLLAAAAHAGIVALPGADIENDLEMQVRNPAAVFPAGAQVGDLLAGHERCAGLETLQAVAAEVAIERMEFQARSRRVLEDDGRAVIALGLVD